jgi:hypothetical protein
VGLIKKLGGLRPISMGDTLRRLTGKAAIRQLREKAASHLKPYQWGVSTSRGCATIAHTARDYLRRHPDHVLLKLDDSNAFNSQSRGQFLSAVATSFHDAAKKRARIWLDFCWLNQFAIVHARFLARCVLNRAAACVDAVNAPYARLHRGCHLCHVRAAAAPAAAAAAAAAAGQRQRRRFRACPLRDPFLSLYLPIIKAHDVCHT